MEDLLVRQNRRYMPLKSDTYFELNEAISLELDKIKSKLKNLHFLDIGAGEEPFADFYKEMFVESADVQQNSKKSIQHIIDPIKPLPFNRDSYDGIFLFDVLEHVKDDIAFIKECSRVIKSNGYLIINVPFMYRFHEVPYDFRRYTPSGIYYLLEELGGFKVELLKPIGSAFFIAEHILIERDYKVEFFRKIIFKIMGKLLKWTTKKNENSFQTAFSYFIIARKLN